MDAEEQPEKQAPDSSHALIKRSEFEIALATANDIVSLKGLYDKVATMEELAKRMKMALDEENRIVEARIEVGRKLGELLHKSVHRGGLGSKFHDGTSIRGGSSAPLPEGITKAMSARLQKVAAIPENEVQRYFALKRHRGEVISMAGLVRTVARDGESPGRRRSVLSKFHRRTTMDVAGLEAVLDAVSRVEEVTACVGMPVPKLWKAAREVPTTAPEKVLRGVVFVAVPPGEEQLRLTQLNAGRRAGRVSDAFVLLPASTNAKWFRCLEDGWSCCFLRSADADAEAQIAAYHGEKRRAFALVFGPLGVVMTPERPHTQE